MSRLLLACWLRCLIAFAYVGLGSLRGDAADAWQFVKNPVSINPTNGLVHANGRWIGVGSFGKIVISTDGVAWTQLPAITEATLRAVTHGGGRFVACGDFGTVVTSVDGLVWELRNTGSSLPLKDVAYGAGTFVMTGRKDGSSDPPRFFSSTDLLTWTTFNTEGAPSSSSAGVTSVSYGNGRFIIPFPGSQMFVSSDGLAWTLKTTNYAMSSPGVSAFDASAGRFYCSHPFARKVLWSEDGETWTALAGLLPFSTNSPHLDLLVDGSRMMLSNSQALFLSTDLGSSWTTHSSGQCGLAKDGANNYVAMTYDGFSILAPDFNWPTRPGRSFDHFADVAYADGQFATVGSRSGTPSNAGVIWSSTNGITWSPRYLSTGSVRLDAICRGNGLWVAAGTKSGAFILTSPDLANWTVGLDSTIYGLKDVTFANGLFVAVGGDYAVPVLLTSADGVSWTSRTSNARGPLTAVTWGNGRFVAVGGHNSGNDGEIVTSPDGITWTRPAFQANTRLRSVAFGNSVFLAGGSYGYLLRSGDGISWETLENDDLGGVSAVAHLSFDGQRFASLREVGLRRALSLSTDGSSWTQQFTGTDHLNAVARGGGKHVAVGSQDDIVVRPDSAFPSPPAGASATDDTVSWQAVAAGNSGFLLYRRLAGTFRWYDADLPVPSGRTSHFVPNLVEGRNYEIGLQAVTTSGLSELVILPTYTWDDLDRWRIANFGSMGVDGDAANDADADRDGTSNLLEYAMSTDPAAPDPPPWTVKQTISPYIRWDPFRTITSEFNYYCDATKTPVNVYLEYSTDLHNWTRMVQSTGGLRSDRVDDFYVTSLWDDYAWYKPSRRLVTVKMERSSSQYPVMYYRLGVEEP